MSALVAQGIEDVRVPAGSTGLESAPGKGTEVEFRLPAAPDEVTEP